MTLKKALNLHGKTALHSVYNKFKLFTPQDLRSLTKKFLSREDKSEYGDTSTAFIIASMAARKELSVVALLLQVPT